MPCVFGSALQLLLLFDFIRVHAQSLSEAFDGHAAAYSEGLSSLQEGGHTGCAKRALKQRTRDIVLMNAIVGTVGNRYGGRKQSGNEIFVKLGHVRRYSGF